MYRVAIERFKGRASVAASSPEILLEFRNKFSRFDNIASICEIEVLLAITRWGELL